MLQFNKNVSKDKTIFTKKDTQLKRVYNYLQNNVATATMVSHATGIPQKSITRYKRDLEIKGLLFEVNKAYCQITKSLAWYITTNEGFIVKNNIGNEK